MKVSQTSLKRREKEEIYNYKIFSLSRLAHYLFILSILSRSFGVLSLTRHVNSARFPGNRIQSYDRKFIHTIESGEASTLLTPGLDNTRLFMSFTAGAGTRCMSLLSSSPSPSGRLMHQFPGQRYYS